MDFLLWLILVSSVHSSPTEHFRRASLSSNRKGLSNEDILKALSILMSETEQGRMESKEVRRGRHEFDDEFSEEDKFDDEFSEEDKFDDEFSEEEELDRQTIRGFSRSTPSFSGLEKCETTGFETRTREECEEVIEVECRPIMVKKIRTEIVEKCETLLDRKTCNVTYIGVPKQQCSPRTSKRCEIDYNIVEEKLYKEECKVNVQHICEEHIKVPIPYPVKDPYHEKPEKLEYSHPHGSPVAKELDHTPPYPNYGHTNHLPTPRPTPPLHLAYQPSVLGAALVGNLFHRQTRAADEADDALQEMVKQALFKVMNKKQFGMKEKDMNKEEHAAPIDFPNHSSHDNPHIIPQQILPQSHLTDSTHFPPKPHSSHHTVHEDHHLVNSDHPITHFIPVHQPGHPSLEHPPIVTSYELPSEPGCRSLATKTCHKIPIIVPKKVPFETCHEVPDVECVTVLKNKPEIECTPEPYEECNDVAKDIPYLEPGEECEEIVFDECLEVEEKIPIELCKRKRVDEESIFLTRGRVFRKEGEKRRRKIGNRKTQSDNSRRVQNREREQSSDYDDEN